MLPRFRRGAFAVFVLAFLVSMLLGDRADVATHLVVEPDAILQGQRWWTPATALFRYPEGIGLLGLLWTLVVQWLVGSRLEGFWGTTRYLVLILVAGLVGHGATVALGLAVPAVREASLAGAAPFDAAALAAFAIVFGAETMALGKWETSPRLVAAILGVIVLVFPLVTAVVDGVDLAHAWPSLVPSAVAALVATLFVQPWRKRTSSGKVERNERRGGPHLRVVRTADDMLN